MSDLEIYHNLSFTYTSQYIAQKFNFCLSPEWEQPRMELNFEHSFKNILAGEWLNVFAPKSIKRFTL